MKSFALAFVAFALIAIPVTVDAAPCRDAKGKFIKCTPKPAVAVKKTTCRNAKGHFMKCPK